MLKMTQVDCIKEMQAKRLSFTEICTRTNLDPKTVRKYMAQEDFSPPAPTAKKHKSIIDEYKPAIEKMLDHDARVWRKQQHTASRICNRLIQEYGAQIEYSTVQRYVKQRKQERKETRAGFNELKWDPGEAQVDFGEADFDTENGMERHPYLVMSLPYSNAGFKQVFDGETAECVCEGLQAIFRHLGGCPRRLVFDNATGVGRRVEKASAWQNCSPVSRRITVSRSASVIQILEMKREMWKTRSDMNGEMTLCRCRTLGIYLNSTVNCWMNQRRISTVSITRKSA
jgi:transposase